MRGTLARAVPAAGQEEGRAPSAQSFRGSVSVSEYHEWRQERGLQPSREFEALVRDYVRQVRAAEGFPAIALIMGRE